jgi:hypothetical protein
MKTSIFELREKYRFEWENWVIDFINRGYGKTEAQYRADEWLEDKYSVEDPDDEE